MFLEAIEKKEQLPANGSNIYIYIYTHNALNHRQTVSTHFTLDCFHTLFDSRRISHTIF